jgi:hypothetical protein
MAKYHFIDSKSGWWELDYETERYHSFPVAPAMKRSKSSSDELYLKDIRG